MQTFRLSSEDLLYEHKGLIYTDSSKFGRSNELELSKNARIALRLTHYHTMPYFDTEIFIAVENIVRKGEIACNKQFLFFSQCFLSYTALIFHFKCTLPCRLQFLSIWTSLQFCRLVMS